MSEWINYSDELYHHGILGMKWGRRRYQNEDGSLTEEGKKRYGHAPGFIKKKLEASKTKRVETKAVEKFKKAEERRKKDPRNLTDEELEIERRKGNIKAIKANLDRLDDTTVSQTIARLDKIDALNKRIKDVEYANSFRGKLDKTIKRIGEVATTVDNMKNSYNKFANIYNSLVDPEDRWPVLDGGKTFDQQAKDAVSRKEEAKAEAEKKIQEKKDAKSKKHEDKIKHSDESEDEFTRAWSKTYGEHSILPENETFALYHSASIELGLNDMYWEDLSASDWDDMTELTHRRLIGN